MKKNWVPARKHKKMNKQKNADFLKSAFFVAFAAENAGILCSAAKEKGLQQFSKNAIIL